MTKLTEIWDKLGVTPWQFKIASLHEAGMSEWEAKNKVVMEWMLAGDFRPKLGLPFDIKPFPRR